MDPDKRKLLDILIKMTKALDKQTMLLKEHNDILRKLTEEFVLKGEEKNDNSN